MFAERLSKLPALSTLSLCLVKSSLHDLHKKTCNCAAVSAIAWSTRISRKQSSSATMWDADVCKKSPFLEPKITVHERHLRKTTTQTRVEKLSQLNDREDKKSVGHTVHLAASFLHCSLGPCTQYRRKGCGVWAPPLQLDLHQTLLTPRGRLFT